MIEAEQTGAARLTEIETALKTHAARENAAAQQERKAREQVDAADREVSRLTARVEALQRLHDSGAGLFAGVNCCSAISIARFTILPASFARIPPHPSF